MARYRKKPVEVEAIQFDGKNQEEVARFMGVVQYDRHSRGIEIDTLEGTHLARPGDWIIRGIQGEYYPCKPDIFEATYEPVEDTVKGVPRYPWHPTEDDYRGDTE